MGDIGRCELIDGVIIPLELEGWEHGTIVSAILGTMCSFVESHQLGQVHLSNTGFTLRRNPDTVRTADVTFVRKDRLPKPPCRGYFDGPPDLAVEVISPSDSPAEVRHKVADWLRAGTATVWLADPPNKTIRVYRGNQPPLIYKGHDELGDEPLLPGFVLKLAEVFRAS